MLTQLPVQSILILTRQVSALALWLFVVLHPDTSQAGEPAFAGWDALAPSVEPYEDPFLEMSYKQKDDLRTILLASQTGPSPALKKDVQEARERLRTEGYDPDALLVQRLIVMEKRRKAATGVTDDFLGQRVFVDGYILPLRKDKGRVYSFLLVPWVGACIHTPPPPPNQMIRVDVSDGIEVGRAFHAIRLRGVLMHAPSVSNLFLVDGQRMVEASYSLNAAQIWGDPDEVRLISQKSAQDSFGQQALKRINRLKRRPVTAFD